MATTVECLNCGATRRAARESSRCVHLEDSCPRCGYVGWAPSADLTETTRRTLRERPLPRRAPLILASAK